MASHDDDSAEKVESVSLLGVTLSEFPVNLEAARAARRHGMLISLGSPNVLRGASLTGNLSGRDALSAGLGDILCSDYSPMSLLHASLQLHREEIMPLAHAVRLVTLNAARATGIDRCTGSIEPGKAAENVIIATIREAFPDHSILTEERGALPGTGGYTWVVDPLDGTVNFWHGLPFFCVSIACYRNPDGTGDEPDGRKASAISGTSVAGAVYLPYMEEFFVAVHGRGATMNGRALRVTAAENTADVVMSVSFGKTPEMMKRMTKRLDVLLPQVRKVRCLGAAAAELAYVAAGYLGGLMYEGIKPWDFAAGKILVEEAGGFLDAVETGKDQWRVVAGAAGIRGAIESLEN